MLAILFVIIALSGYVGWHLWMLPPALWLRWTLVGVEAACVAMAVLSLTRYLDRMPYGLSVAVYNVGNKGLIILLYLFMAFLLAELAGIGLQVSGHTHRGQVWPLSWITDAMYECSWGTLKKGETTVCVTSGLGIWGAKYRIGTQSEYLVINLIP